MQAAKLFHDVEAGAHPQVEGVAQDDLRAHFLQAAWHHALDGAVGAHRHEDGGFNDAVVQRQAPASCVAAGIAAVGVGGVGVEQFKFQHAGGA